MASKLSDSFIILNRWIGLNRCGTCTSIRNQVKLIEGSSITPIAQGLVIYSLILVSVSQIPNSQCVQASQLFTEMHWINIFKGVGVLFLFFTSPLLGDTFERKFHKYSVECEGEQDFHELSTSNKYPSPFIIAACGRRFEKYILVEKTHPQKSLFLLHPATGCSKSDIEF